MNKHLTREDKRKFLHILHELNQRSANIFTQKELSLYLGVSLRKMSDFLNGLIFDFWLLRKYGDILGLEVKFNINKP